MLAQVKFTVPGEPTGKGRPRFGARYSPKQGRAFVNVRTPEKTIMYENLVKTEYEQQTASFRFDDDMMLDLRIVAFYAIPKSASKKKRNLMLQGLIRPTKKPDMDNVMKIIADSLNDVAYHDDTQIVDAQCRKFYAEIPRVIVSIREIGKVKK